MPEREGTFYPVWPVIDGKNLNMQWGEIRSNTAETKAIVRNSVQDLETGVDELNALRALLGLEFGDLDFRSKFRFFYNKTTFELCCQKNDGTVDSPTWVDAWCVRFTDGQFQAVGTGGIQSDAGFYGPGLSSLGEIGETGSAADNTVLNPTKLFFNTDDGLEVETISAGANAGSPEIRFTQPFGRAQTFDKLGREWIVQHDFNASPVMVQLYDDNDRVIFPDKADVSDPNTAYFYFHAATTGKVTIATGGTGAASLVPRDPFYIVIRSDGQPAAEHTLEPNADLIFDSTQFYVNVDLDTDTGGSHKKAFVSIHSVPSTGLDHGGLQGLADDDHAQYARTDGTRDITGHQRFDDTINVENAVTAEAFYVHNTAELSEVGVRTPDGSAAVVPHSFTSAPNSGMLLDGSADLKLIRAGDIKVTAHSDRVAITNGYFEVASNPIRANEGDAGGPGYTFDLDPDTGLFGAGNALGFSTGGIERGRIAADGLNVVDKVKAEAFYVASGGSLEERGLLVPSGSITAPGMAFLDNPLTGFTTDDALNMQVIVNGTEMLEFQPNANILDFKDTIRALNGNAAGPGIRFAGSANTGLFQDSEDVNITAEGKEVARFGKDEVRITASVHAEAFYVSGSSNEINDVQFLGEDGPSSAPTFSYTSQPTSGWGLQADNPTLYKLGSSKISVSTSSVSIQNSTLRVPGNNALFANGSAASPSISFDDYQDLGFWAPADHTLGFTTQGVNRMTLAADGMNVTDKVVAEAFYVASGGELNELGVLVPDGSEPLPAMAFTAAPSTGMFRDGSGNPTFVKLGATKMTLRTSDVLFASQLNLPNGLATAPSIRFAGGSDTGIYRSAVETLGITVNGTHAAHFGKDGLTVEDKVVAEAFYTKSGGDLAETWVSFDIAGAAVDNYFINTAGADFDVLDVAIITSTGSATVAFYIHSDGETTPGIGIPGLDPIAASTTRATAAAGAPFTVLDGEELVMSVPANSFATHLRGRVKIRRLN